VLTTFCPLGEGQATITPIVDQVEEPWKNCKSSFSEWLFPPNQDTSTMGFTYNPSIGIFGFKVKKDNESEIETRFISSTNNIVLEKIESRIFNRLSFPSHWAGDDVVPPNMASKVKAFEICRNLFENHTLIPDRIACTKEEGVFLAFDTNSGERTLVIEIYNDLEVGLLVNDNVEKRVLFSEEITDLDFSPAVNILNG
jgi:hypothetical protein